MKRRTHPVQKSGQSPWRRYKKGKGGGTGGLGPGSMWVDKGDPEGVKAALIGVTTPSLAHDLVHGDLTIDDKEIAA